MEPKFLCVSRRSGACIAQGADEGGIPGRISTEENVARCVPGRREA